LLSSPPPPPRPAIVAPLPFTPHRYFRG
jgi:hypothetical protein